MDYRSAGVDISKGDSLVARIKAMMGSAGERIGHFGGVVPFPRDEYIEPLLVSSVDSVGTKTAVAMALNIHDGIGLDMVHHSINDIACCGAEPLYFLDYFAMASLNVDLAAEVIGGVIAACERWKVRLIGGETAEMPGVYREGEYDLVGAITGVVEKSDYIDGFGIVDGDVLIGFASSGLHTNGYSLARKVVEVSDIEYDTVIPELGMTVGEALLAEHRCYLDEIQVLKHNYNVKGLAHITGGGIIGNVKRIIPDGLRAEIDWDSWDEPPIFNLLRVKGNIPEDDMRRTFNLGIGLVAVLAPERAQSAIQEFPAELHRPLRVGEVITEE